jgi:hypothetical protein
VVLISGVDWAAGGCCGRPDCGDGAAERNAHGTSKMQSAEAMRATIGAEKSRSAAAFIRLSRPPLIRGISVSPPGRDFAMEVASVLVLSMQVNVYTVSILPDN